MVFAACDDQGLVAVCTGRVDGLVEPDACFARLLQVGRLLDHGRRRNGVARGLLLNHPVDRAGEQRERCEFADDPTKAITRTTAIAVAPRPAAPRVGPVAIARVVAPTNRANTKVNGTTTGADKCTAGITARVVTNHVNATLTSTTTPATACVDRS